MDFCTFDLNGEWQKGNYYCFFYSGSGSYAKGLWYTNYNTQHAMRIYSEANSGGLDETTGKISVLPPSATTQSISYFNEGNAILEDTYLISDGYGYSQIGLQFVDKVVAIVFDESGSMSWVDPSNFRRSLIKDFIDKISSDYPMDVRYKLFKFGGKDVKFLVSASVLGEDPFTVADNSFYESYIYDDKENNYAGVRVVRRTDGYSATPIDGDIIYDGVASSIVETQLTENENYYYTVFTFDQNYRFSTGVRIPVVAKTGASPRGIKTCEAQVLKGSSVIVDDYVESVWHFNEGIQNRVYDFAANYDLTISDTNPVWLRSVNVISGNSGVRFNGSSTRLNTDLGANYKIGSTDTKTIMMWAKPYDTGDNQYIMGLEKDAQNIYSLLLTSDGKLTFAYNGVTNLSVSNIGVINYGEWNHIAITVDGSTGDILFYVNGIDVGESFSLSASFIDDIDDAYLNIGLNVNDVYTYAGFFGQICDLSIHSTIRSPSYIADQYNLLAYDNGDRLIVLSYTIPDWYGFDGYTVHAILNEDNIPTYMGDGQLIDSRVVASGEDYIVTYREDFVLGQSQYVRVFSEDLTGLYSHKKDSMGLSVYIPFMDQQSYDSLASPDVVLSAPLTLESKSGNKKAYLNWTLDLSDSEIKRVRVYRSTSAFPTIVDGSISDGTLVFDGNNFDLYYVDRDLLNNVHYFYSIVTVDRYGRISESLNTSVEPYASADEASIPLQEVREIGYHNSEDGSIELYWNDVIQSKSVEAYFGNDVVFFMQLTDQYGNPLDKDYRVTAEVTSHGIGYHANIGEDVFVYPDIFDTSSDGVEEQTDNEDLDQDSVDAEVEIQSTDPHPPKSEVLEMLPDFPDNLSAASDFAYIYISSSQSLDPTEAVQSDNEECDYEVYRVDESGDRVMHICYSSNNETTWHVVGFVGTATFNVILSKEAIMFSPTNKSYGLFIKTPNFDQQQLTALINVYKWGIGTPGTQTSIPYTAIQSQEVRDDIIDSSDNADNSSNETSVSSSEEVAPIIEVSSSEETVPVIERTVPVAAPIYAFATPQIGVPAIEHVSNNVPLKISFDSIETAGYGSSVPNLFQKPKYYFDKSTKRIYLSRSVTQYQRLKFKTISNPDTGQQTRVFYNRFSQEYEAVDFLRATPETLFDHYKNVPASIADIQSSPRLRYDQDLEKYYIKIYDLSQEIITTQEISMPTTVDTTDTTDIDEPNIPPYVYEGDSNIVYLGDSYIYHDGPIQSTGLGNSDNKIEGLYTLVVSPFENGLSKGVFRLTSNWDNLKNIALIHSQVVFKVVLDSGFEYRSKPIKVVWRNPLSFDLENRDSRYITVNQKYKINALDNQIPSSIKQYDGSYATTSRPYVTRVFIYDRDEASSISASNIEATVYNVDVDLKDPSSTPVATRFSDDVYVTNDLVVEKGTREIVDDYGNPTGDLEATTYVDISLSVPENKRCVWLFVRVTLDGTNYIVKKKLIVFDSPLQIDIQPRVPFADGRQKTEQSAMVYLVDPDFPTDISKRVYPDNGTKVEWELNKKSNAVDRLFYSSDDDNLADGISSTVNNGIAKSVFLGPLNGVVSHGVSAFGGPIYETHEIKSSVFYNGYAASDSQDIELIPLRDKGHRIMSSNFLMEFVEFKNKLWSDGIDYQTLIISHNPNTSQTKYSDSFVQTLAVEGKPIYELQYGQIVLIDTNDEDVEIIWGDVVEYLDPYLNRWLLDTTNANTAKGSALIDLSEYDSTYVYFRYYKNVSQSTVGFEELETKGGVVGSNKYTKYSKEIVVTGQIAADFNGDVVTLVGGGDLQTGIIPTVIIPDEALQATVVDRRATNVDGQQYRVDNLIVDGKTVNELIIDVSLAGKALPEEASLAIYIQNYGENSVRSIQDIITTSTYIDEDILEGEARSYAILKLHTLQPHLFIAAKIDITVSLSHTSSEIGPIFRTITTSTYIRYDADDYKMDLSQSSSKSIFSSRCDAYNLIDASWSNLDSLSIPRGHMCVETDGSYIFAIGGVSSSSISGIVEKYSVLSNSWEMASSMPTARMASASVLSGDYIYIIGGIEHNLQSNTVSVSRTIERYSISADTWESLADMPSIDVGAIEEMPYGVAYATAEVIGGSIYVFSGVRRITEDGVYIEHNDRILSYNIAGDVWSYSDAVTDLDLTDYQRISPVSIVDGNDIYICGGAHQLPQLSLEYIIGAYGYNVVSGALSDVSGKFDLPFSRRYLAASAVDSDVLYVSGGYSDVSEFSEKFEKVEKNGDLYEFTEMTSWPVAKNGASGVIISINGDSHYIVIGGIESGKASGFLSLNIEPYEDTFSLNGMQNLDILVSASDASGDTNINATIKLTGYLQRSDSSIVDVVDRESTQHNVLFESENLQLVDGIGIGSLVPRSADLIDNICDSFWYDFNGYNESYKILIQATVVSGSEDIPTTMGNDFSYYGQTFIGTTDDRSSLDIIVSDGSVPLLTNTRISSLNPYIIHQHNVFKLVSLPLYQNSSAFIRADLEGMTVPDCEDLTSSGSVSSTAAKDLIDLIEDSPHGSSPLYDSLETVSEIMSGDSFLDNSKIIYVMTDRDSNASKLSNTGCIKSINAIGNPLDVPVILGNIYMGDNLQASYSGGTGDIQLDKLSYFTGGQSFVIGTALFSSDYLNMMFGKLKGSFGYGRACYVFDIEKAVNLRSINCSINENSTSNIRWRVSVSDDGYSYSPYSIWFNDSDEATFDSLECRYIKFDYELTSWGSSHVDAYVDGFNLSYVDVKKDYIFANVETVEADIQQTVITVDTNDDSESLDVGVSFSDSVYWNDFDNESKPAVRNGGKIVSPIRDELQLTEFYESLDKINEYTYKAANGSWGSEAQITIYDSSNIEIDSSSYVLYPGEGIIIFNTKVYDTYRILISDPNKRKIGMQISNTNTAKNIEIYGVGRMYSTESTSKDYMTGEESVITSLTSVCSAAPWVDCSNIATAAHITTDCVPGYTGCYDEVAGVYSLEDFIDTVGFVGWWFVNTNSVVLIIIYCKSDSKYYGQIFNRNTSEAVYGASTNECPCVTLNSDRFGELPENVCCDNALNYLGGTFVLDGVNSCSLWKATVTLTNG